MVEISAATTAVLFINAEAKAVQMRVLRVDLNLEPLIITAETRRKTLVRSKANEHSTRSTKVTKPGFTTFVNTVSAETRPVAKQASSETAKTFSGFC